MRKLIIVLIVLIIGYGAVVLHYLHDCRSGKYKEVRIMTAYDFKFVIDTGLIVYICAPSRKEAIKLFCEEHECDDEYIKNHVVIRRCGKICG